jgi:hypothetical protein
VTVGGATIGEVTVNRYCTCQAALLADRVPVWPDFACDSPWLLNDEARARLRKGEKLERSQEAGSWRLGSEWRSDLEIVPRQPVDGPPSSRRCLVWHFYESECDVHVRHLSQPCSDYGNCS